MPPSRRRARRRRSCSTATPGRSSAGRRSTSSPSCASAASIPWSERRAGVHQETASHRAQRASGHYPHRPSCLGATGFGTHLVRDPLGGRKEPVAAPKSSSDSSGTHPPRRRKCVSREGKQPKELADKVLRRNNGSRIPP